MLNLLDSDIFVNFESFMDPIYEDDQLLLAGSLGCPRKLVNG